jgi:hypothetical protein
MILRCRSLRTTFGGSPKLSPSPSGEVPDHRIAATIAETTPHVRVAYVLRHRVFPQDSLLYQ